MTNRMFLAGWEKRFRSRKQGTISGWICGEGSLVYRANEANPFAVIVYVPGASTWLLCSGAGQFTLTSGPSILFLPEYLSRVSECRPATDDVYRTRNKQGDQQQ